MQEKGFSSGSAGKDHLQCRRSRFDPWVGKIPWRRERLPAPVFWPGEFHGPYGRSGHRVGHDWVTFTPHAGKMEKGSTKHVNHFDQRRKTSEPFSKSSSYWSHCYHMASPNCEEAFPAFLENGARKESHSLTKSVGHISLR